MPNTQLNEANKQFVLNQFKVGVSPQNILNALDAAGNTGINLQTIQQCLLTNTNEMFDPAFLPASTSQSGPSTKNQKPSNSQSREPPPALSWNDRADEFAMSGHNAGKTVAEITTILCRNGYAVSQTQVGQYLIEQGAQNVRW